MEISISPEPIFHIGHFTVTNTLLTSWLVVIAMIIIAIIINRKIRFVPGRLQSLVEITIEQLSDFLQTFAGDKATIRRYFPLIATIFFFILTANWAGTLPGIETIGIHELHGEEMKYLPIFRTVNSDVNVTLALALIVVIASHIVGFGSIGAKHHLGKFIVNPFKDPIGFFVGFLEIIGEISRIVSLTFRLFGNIFAGSVLMLVISFLVPFIVPIPFLGLELFVGFIQAIVFASLATLFIASATKSHEAH